MTSSPWAHNQQPYAYTSPHTHYSHRLRFPIGAACDHQIPPWGFYHHNMPGIPMNFPLPTLPPPPPSCHLPVGPTGNILTTPLPTVLFPFPLDPLCPPTVLPFFGNATSESSGYSTAGHSRSSSPMLVTPGGGPYISNSGPDLPGNGSSLNTASQFSVSRNASPSSLSPNSGSSGSLSSATSYQTNNHHVPAQYPPNVVFEAPSTEITMLSHFPTVPGQFVVFFHINPGVSVSFGGGDHGQIIKGPMTVPMVCTNSSSPPVPLPMQVPPGHVVQQIVDESGTLRHVIVSHQPVIPIASYNAGCQNLPYFPPGPLYHPPFGQTQTACVTHSNQGPASSSGPMSGIPSPCKDESVHSQYSKLPRNLDQKTRDEQPNHFIQNGGYISQNEYACNNNNNNGIRRSLVNGISKVGVGEEEGSIGSSDSVTSSGTQDDEVEATLTLLTDMMSSIAPPVVTEVTRQSAFIKWKMPDRSKEVAQFEVSDNDFRYEVFIGDNSRPESQFKSIFLGTGLSCRVKDLKPGTSYSISYCVMLPKLDVKGVRSAPASFTTLAGEPDPPPSPRAITRNRNSLTFKWNAPNDNGAKITAYVLEYDEGKGGSHFTEAYRGKNKQCTVSRLQPAYSYQFRLAAINEIGKSRFSPSTTVMTAGSPPAQPAPPTLLEAGVTHLTLEWNRRPDEEYSLQMEDTTTGHGYLGAYNGNAAHCTCDGLKRYTEYKFRIKAHNGEGHSKWSDEVVLRTLPGQPQPPQKPTLKGKTHATAFKVKWEPPVDTGGIPLTAYSLEIDQGKGDFTEIYFGPETEFLVDKLCPGQSYQLRVLAIGEGGVSEPSESCVITTDPVCPGKCHIPRIIGKPKSNSVHLKWTPPDSDGGSPVNSYEVGCTTPDNLTQEAYRGKETSCYVNGLLPGRSYLFQIRAYNRVGAGPWSDPLEVISGPGSPDPPTAPKVAAKGSHSAIVTWTEPLNNGSAVTEYKLQMALCQLSYSESSPVATSPTFHSGAMPNVQSTSLDGCCLPANHDDQSPDNTSRSTESLNSLTLQNPNEMLDSFTQVYIGPNTLCEVKNLQPAAVYFFRLQASNCAGSSDWSSTSRYRMPPSSPDAVTHVEGNPTSSSIVLNWAVPSCNGSPILHYNLMVGESMITSYSNTYVLDNLMPDVHHKIRIQAVNVIGPGPFSSVLKVSTKPLPPVPPKLELLTSSHIWLKLKWTPEPSQKNSEYIVQMINPFQDEFQVVYRGSLPSCKVTRLTEDTIYQFRICGINSAGHGHFSDMYRFSTLKAPPPQVKGLKVTLEKDAQLHRLEWSDVNCSGTVIYQLQIAKKQEQEFKLVYRGENRQFSLKFEELDRGVAYSCRVCAIRVIDDGNSLAGTYSAAISFTNPFPTPEIYARSSKSHPSQSFATNLTATAQVLEQKMNSISYESKVGLMAVIALIFLAIIISLVTHHVVS